MNKIWKRNKQTTELVNQIRNAVKDNAGVIEEFAITPLLYLYSVVGRTTDGQLINVRLDKSTLRVITIDVLSPVQRRDKIVYVRRTPL